MYMLIFTGTMPNERSILMSVENTLKQITVNMHSSIRIGGETVIYVDPIGISDAPHDADLVLITHPHFDHFSPGDIKKVMKDNTVIACPKASAALCRLLTGKKPVTVSPGQSLSLCGVPVETVAAYNKNKPMHAKFFRFVGYVLTMDDTRVYISGDTDYTPEASAVQCDIAMIPIGGTYTMNPVQAASLVNQIAPKAVIPVHYGLALGGQDAPETFRAHLQPGIQADIRPTVYSKVMLRVLPLLLAAAVVLIFLVLRMIR